MIVKANSKIYYSELGEKGFLYPSSSFFLLSHDASCELPPFLYNKEHGLVPVKIMAKIGGDGISYVENSIFWVEKKLLVPKE